MTRLSFPKSPLIIISVVAPLVLVSARPHASWAFDSAGVDLSRVTPNLPNYPMNWPETPSFPTVAWDPFITARMQPDGGAASWQNIGQSYAYSINHLQSGGIVGDGSDDAVSTGLFICPLTAISNGTVALANGCSPVSSANFENYPVGAIGWVRLRKRWDTEPTDAVRPLDAPEHMEILQEALKVAGLSQLPLFTTRFWMRYPAADKLVTSPVTPARLPVADAGANVPFNVLYYVGPSLVPTSFGNLQVHAVRSVYLPELAQMPDVSNSVEDWAAGNELCPVTGFSDGTAISAFGGAMQGQSTPAGDDGGSVLPYDVNACHDFTRIMGTVNSSHFLPQSRGFYNWYHQLAMQRMTQCQTLAPLLQSPYFYAQQGADGLPVSDGGLSVGGTPPLAGVYMASAVPAGEWFADSGVSQDGSVVAPSRADGGDGGWWSIVAGNTSPKGTLDYTAPYDTEAHECEREAMVYEMFAQHYLQDAWSTGHMWARWGFPNFADFPATVNDSDVLGDARNVYARRFVIAGVAGGFAGMIHGAEAVTHTVLDSHPFWNAVAPSALVQSVLADPLSGPNLVVTSAQTQLPNAGILFSDAGTPLVSWADESVGAADPVPIRAGVGDLFWNPPNGALAQFLGANAALRSGAAPGTTYSAEYNKLMGCSAHSLQDVYNAGNKAYGPQQQPTLVLDTDNNPNADVCWNHWATNVSMFGALDPLRLDSHSMFAQFVWGYSNRLVIDERVATVQFPGADDEASFLSHLESQLAVDAERVLMTALGNAFVQPNGTQTAKLAAFEGPLTFLSIPPNSFAGPGPALADAGASAWSDGGTAGSLAAAADGSIDATASEWDEPGFTVGIGRSIYMFGSAGDGGPPVAFADRGAPPAGSPPGGGYSMMSNMFWKSHIAEQCAHPEDVQSLRDRCVGAAPNGGDPEACTACVERAETFIPPCYEMESPAYHPELYIDQASGFTGDSWYQTFETPALAPSKCQLITSSSSRDGLPPEWFDLTARGLLRTVQESYYDPIAKLWLNAFPKMSCGSPPYYQAVLYCTGAAPYWYDDAFNTPMQYQMPIATNGLFQAPANTECFGLGVCPMTTDMRGVATRYTPGVIGGLGPVISAADYSFQIDPTPYGIGPFSGPSAYHSHVTTSLDSAAQQIIGGLPIYSADGGQVLLTNFEGDDVSAPRGIDVVNPQFCGLTQRMSVQNESCAEAAVSMPGFPAACIANGVMGSPCYDAPTGATVASLSQPGVPPMCAVREAWTVTGCAGGTTCSSSGICRASATSQAASPPMLFAPDMVSGK